jgi:hypothetical protein
MKIAHRTIALAAGAVTLAAGGTALADDHDGRRVLGAAGGPQVLKVDVDQLYGGRVRLEAKTTGASRMAFVYGGRRYQARLVDADFEDGTRDWVRIITTGRAAGRVATVAVRACRAQACASGTVRKFVDRPDRDDDLDAD